MYLADRATVFDFRELLRVKVCALALEVKATRLAERKTHGLLRESLRMHRIYEIRYRARHAYLALGLLRGRSWRQIEPVARSQPDWCEVRRLLHTYGPTHWNLRYDAHRDVVLEHPQLAMSLAPSNPADA